MPRGSLAQDRDSFLFHGDYLVSQPTPPTHARHQPNVSRTSAERVALQICQTNEQGQPQGGRVLRSKLLQVTNPYLTPGIFVSPEVMSVSHSSRQKMFSNVPLCVCLLSADPQVWVPLAGG